MEREIDDLATQPTPTPPTPTPLEPARSLLFGFLRVPFMFFPNPKSNKNKNGNYNQKKTGQRKGDTEFTGFP